MTCTVRGPGSYHHQGLVSVLGVFPVHTHWFGVSGGNCPHGWFTDSGETHWWYARVGQSALCSQALLLPMCVRPSHACAGVESHSVSAMTVKTWLMHPRSTCQTVVVLVAHWGLTPIRAALSVLGNASGPSGPQATTMRVVVLVPGHQQGVCGGGGGGGVSQHFRPQNVE